MIENLQGDKAGQKEGHTPKNAATNVQDDSTPYYLTLPRERRCILALATAGSEGVLRHDLDEATGAQNSPEYVRRLRVMGWEIKTERIPHTDRDGRRVRVGRYRLAMGQIEAALKQGRA